MNSIGTFLSFENLRLNSFEAFVGFLNRKIYTVFGFSTHLQSVIYEIIALPGMEIAAILKFIRWIKIKMNRRYSV